MQQSRRNAVPTDFEINTMITALTEAREVNRLLTTPEGLRELEYKSPAGGGRSFREEAKIIAKENIENIGYDKVNPLEFGTYGDQAARSMRDGLTPDHIPSFAAVRTAIENNSGRQLTPAEKKRFKKYYVYNYY